MTLKWKTKIANFYNFMKAVWAVLIKAFHLIFSKEVNTFPQNT